MSLGIWSLEFIAAFAVASVAAAEPDAEKPKDDRVYEMHGDIWSNIPLRHRRAGLVTRITEGMTRWTCEDRIGAGLTEHLDQIVDGVAVGIAAGI